MMELILNDICDSHLGEMLDYGSMKYSCSHSALLVKTNLFVKCTEITLECYWNKIIFNTRTHSSRMRTVRCSSHLKRGCLTGGVCPGVSALEGLPGGGGRCLPPSHVNRITDGCENMNLIIKVAVGIALLN